MRAAVVSKQYDSGLAKQKEETNRPEAGAANGKNLFCFCINTVMDF